MKKLHTFVAVLGLAALSAGAWWLQNKPTGAAGAMAGAGSGAAPGPAASAPRVGGPAGPGGPGGAGPAGGGRGGPAPVEVAKAESATITDDIQAVGSLKSARSVMLRPEVSGRIAQLGFANGARVQQGQLLVQLDDTLQQAQLKQSEAQANIARTRLARNRELQGQGFVSQSAVDQAQADLQVAEAQVSLTQAQINRMKVLAPFNGTTGLRKVEVGDYIKDGADIVNIDDLNALTVQFALPERTLDRLRVGQAVDLTLDGLPGRRFKGQVVALDSQVDANGRALQVLAKVINTGALLKPGMFARPRVVFAVRDNAVVVPEEALVPLGGKQYVFKVVDGEDGRKLTQRVEARLGSRLPGKVELLEGLQAGDTVVTAGHGRLLRGDKLPVRIVDLDKPRGAPRAPGAAGKVSEGGGGAPAAAGSAPGTRAPQP